MANTFSFERVHVRVYMYMHIYVRAHECVRVRAYVHTCVLNFQAASHTCPCVGSRALAGCCVYASDAKDASIAGTHLERRRVFCSRTFRMYSCNVMGPDM